MTDIPTPPQGDPDETTADIQDHDPALAGLMFLDPTQFAEDLQAIEPFIERHEKLAARIKAGEDFGLSTLQKLGLDLFIIKGRALFEGTLGYLEAVDVFERDIATPLAQMEQMEQKRSS